MNKIFIVGLELKNLLLVKQIEKKDLPELKNKKNRQMNRKNLFETMSLSLNYSKEIVKGGFEEGQMKDIIQSI